MNRKNVTPRASVVLRVQHVREVLLSRGFPPPREHAWVEKKKGEELPAHAAEEDDSFFFASEEEDRGIRKR